MLDKSAVNERLKQIDSDYQLVIIGGGVYGAALCWEATHRGIKTLLVEQEDYACGASSNSLKTIHGGLRSLQSLNLNAVIKGIRERSNFLRIAPNYVKQLPCLLPTTNSLMKSKPVVGMGLLLYNLLNQLNSMFDVSDDKVGNAGLLSRSKFLLQVPGINPEAITGGAIWYDAQVVNTERLVWQFIKSAIKKGAVAMNHVAAISHSSDNAEAVHSVMIRDQLSGDEKNITTAAIVDCSAAWSFIRSNAAISEDEDKLTFLKSVNIIVKNNLFVNAFGASVKSNQSDSSRLYFFSPWRDHMMIGTWYSDEAPYPQKNFSKNDATACIDEINSIFSEELLKTDDICNVHIGYLPAEVNQSMDKSELDKNLIKNYQFKDWSDKTGLRGIYSLRGTKYTLARYDAEKVVDELARSMNWQVASSQSDKLPIYQQASLPDNRFDLSDEVVSNLLLNYGEDVERLYDYIENFPQSIELIPGTQHHIMAEIYYAVFYEQALTLCDLLKRRLDVGDYAPPDSSTAQYCSEVMQQLLAWSDKKMLAQITELYDSYPDFISEKKRVSPSDSSSYE